jgi:PAS domain S-box-containing protein
MSATSRQLVLSYGIAAVGVILAGSSHWWLVPLIGDSPPVRLMLVVAVTGSAWLGGLGPGLFATAMGLIAIVAADDAPGDLGSLLTRLWRFGSLGLLITGLFAALHAHRRRAEMREREFFHSELRYRRLVETTGEGIWAIDRDGRTAYANPRMGEILGVSPDRLVGRPITDFVVDPRDDPRTWLDPPEGPLIWHEVRLRGDHAGGDRAIRDTIATVRPIGPDEAVDVGAGAGRRGGPGGSGSLLLMVTDVTSLKRAERALREKESLLRSFYESSAMAMGVIELIDDDARLVSANALTDRFFGLGAGAREGLTAKQLGAPPERLAIWIERFHQCRATGQPVRYECRNLWPTCPEWVAVTLSAMDIPGSEVNLCSFVIEDVTERKRTEEALRVAKELAEAASQAKDRFLAVLSHELRTPLTPVLIAVSSMLESNTDPALLSALEMIRRNIELEARLIDDLLDLSRIVRGRLRLDLEVVDVHHIIRRAVEICRDEVLVAGLIIATDLKARHYHVMADYARTMQVTWNLIHNAVKFTPADGRITIRTTNRPGPPRLGDSPVDGQTQRLVIEFEDTGMGIDPQVLPRIFDAFEQGHDDLRGRSGGLGLGLAISRSLAAAMGGRLTVSSRGRGLGSTFRLELTTAPTPAAAAVTRPAAASPAAPSLTPRGRVLRILLVEDNADTLRFLASVLRRRGHDVVTADCIAAARATVAGANAPFDLLLSDVELPDGSGPELMRELGARGGWLGIAMSGFGTEEDLQLSRDAGFLDHLTKPIDLNRLDAVIRRAAGQRGDHADEIEPFRSRTDANASGEFPIARTQGPQ